MIRKIKVLTLLFLTSTVFAAEGDLYDFSWLDKDKEVYVLQNRKFKKKNKFHFAGGYGKTISGSFVDATSMQFRGSYFFTEELGFEFVYSKNSGEENEAAASVRDDGNGSGTIPFRRIVDGYYGGMVTWAPFYSKINTFNKIIYLDFIFGLGLAQIEETNNRNQFITSNANAGETTETHSGLMWNAAAKFYLTERWNVRFDINAIHYKAKRARVDINTDDYWYNNFDMTLALGIDI
jgi:outer membrane beta-barrel protein